MNQKAQVMAETVAQELSMRVPSMAPVVAGVVNGEASVSCGTGVAGAKNALIVFNGSLSNAPAWYSPLVCRLVTEVGALGPAEILPLFATLAVSTGLRIEWYESAKGTPPSAADLKGAPVAAT